MKIAKIFCICLLVSIVSCRKPKPSIPDHTISDHSKFEGASFLEIIPLADGGAYANDFDKIWYLKENRAVLVKEMDTTLKFSMDSLKTEKEKYLWAQLQIEKAKRKKCEDSKQTDQDNNEE